MLKFISGAFIFILVVLFVFRKRIRSGVSWILDDIQRVGKEKQFSQVNVATTQLDWILLGIAIILGGYSVYLSIWDVGAYRVFIDEDGFVEYASACLWFLAAIFALISLFIDRRMFKVKSSVYIVLIIFFFVCGGEEISWGQRIIGFEGPEIVTALNKQNEMNIHDIGSISVFANTFFIISLVFFFILPFIQKKYAEFKIYLNYYNVPIFTPVMTYIFAVGLITWIIIGIRFGTLGFHPFSAWGFYTQMDDEIYELFAAYSFFSFSIINFVHRIKNE
jgi:hypothetical protein